jgi:hypothetical protein
MAWNGGGKSDLSPSPLEMPLAGDTAESMLERARQNMQTVSHEKPNPTKSAEGAASGS